MGDERPIQRSGGGIVSRGGERAGPREIDSADLPELMRSWRRRWTTGVAIATTTTADGALRGITLTSVMPLSLDPPMIAFGLVADGEFAEVLAEAGRCCVHILDHGQEFLSERFAGRAPLPDATFTGVPHEMVDGLPVLDGVLAWSMGDVDRIEPVGDHLLIVLRVSGVVIGEDTDDPLVTYEGRYRGLEAS